MTHQNPELIIAGEAATRKNKPRFFCANDTIRYGRAIDSAVRRITHWVPVSKVSTGKRPPKIAAASRIRRPPLSRTDVTRAEYNNIIEVLNQRGEIINDLRRELEVQFKRMAQMQSELDELRRAWLKS